ncbi:MAG TPA: hypothetical protein VF602_00040 [Pedobacter sp.]|jgi:hypothetical protein
MKLKTLITGFTLLLSFYACKKDHSVTNEIYGEWYEERQWDDSLIFRQAYNFRKNGGIVITNSLISSATAKQKGLISRIQGSFSFSGDSLVISNIGYYTSGGEGPKRFEELIYIAQNSRTAYKPVYSQDKSILTLFFNCPDFANCIPFPKLTRVKF